MELLAPDPALALLLSARRRLGQSVHRQRRPRAPAGPGQSGDRGSRLRGLPRDPPGDYRRPRRRLLLRHRSGAEGVDRGGGGNSPGPGGGGDDGDRAAQRAPRAEAAGGAGILPGAHRERPGHHHGAERRWNHPLRESGRRAGPRVPARGPGRQVRLRAHSSRRSVEGDRGLQRTRHPGGHGVPGVPPAAQGRLVALG